MVKTSTGSPDPPINDQRRQIPRPLAGYLARRASSLLARQCRAWRSNIASFELYSRDAGKREAKLAFDVGQGTQDLGFRNEVAILFECEPAVELKLDVLDDDGTADDRAFIFRDTQGRVYPRAAAAGARLLLPRPGLPRRRRDGPAAAGQYDVDVHPRAGISRSDAANRTVPDAAEHREVVPAQALDQAGRPRLVLGRSPCPRRRLRPLRIARPKASRPAT